MPARVSPDVATAKSVASARAGNKGSTGHRDLYAASSTVKSAHLGTAGDGGDDDDGSVALTRKVRHRATNRFPVPDRTFSMSCASARPLKVQSAALGIAGYEDSDDDHDKSFLNRMRPTFPARPTKVTSMQNARNQPMARAERNGNSGKTAPAGAGHCSKSYLVDLSDDDDFDNGDDKKPRAAARPKPEILDLCKHDNDGASHEKTAARAKPEIIDLSKDEDSGDDNKPTPLRAATSPAPVPSGIIDRKKSDDHDDDDKTDDSSVSPWKELDL